MLRPNAQALHNLGMLSTQYPEVVAWLNEWYQHELTGLPYAKDNAAHAQGRCQALGELLKLIKNAPEYAANPHNGKPRTPAHTDRSV